MVLLLDTVEYFTEHSTLLNRLQTRTKKCCIFPAAWLQKRNNFLCSFATYSTLCIEGISDF